MLRGHPRSAPGVPQLHPLSRLGLSSLCLLISLEKGQPGIVDHEFVGYDEKKAANKGERVSDITAKLI